MKRILLVEDDPQVRAMLADTLKGARFKVETAENGREALVRFEDGFDLVITDILMPEGEGLSLITELKKRSPGTPVAAISGGGKHLTPGCNLELAGMFGADACFEKPVELDAFLKKIKTLLGRE